jgi:hypothetical protein
MDLLQMILNEGNGRAVGQQGGLLDMLTPMLDSDRDGSITDDVLGMLGKTFGR